MNATTPWRILVPPLLRRLVNSAWHAQVLVRRHPRGPELAGALRLLQERQAALLRELCKRRGAA